MKKLMNQKRKLESVALKGILLTSFILSSCDTNDDNNIKQNQDQTSKEEVKKGTFLGEEITYIRKDGKNIFQGDMLITDEQLNENLQSRGAVAPRLRWPNNTVYYTLSNSILNNRNLLTRVNNAIREYNTRTNVRWVQASSNTPSYVNFVHSGRNGSDGSATIGRQSGYKFVSLDGNAPLGTIIHEMGHTIGLFHEHTRRDRDNHLIINWNNIQQGQNHNFQKYNLSNIGNDGVDLVPFDINSVMMYWSNSYSRNGQPTIVLRNGRTFNYVRNGFTTSDITAINRMYPRR